MKNIKRHIVLVDVIYDNNRVDYYAVSRHYIRNFNYGIEDPSLLLKFSLVCADEKNVESFALLSEFDSKECIRALESWNVNEQFKKSRHGRVVKSLQSRIVDISFDFKR